MADCEFLTNILNFLNANWAQTINLVIMNCLDPINLRKIAQNIRIFILNILQLILSTLIYDKVVFRVSLIIE